MKATRSKRPFFFRGREMTRTGLGREILERLIKDIGDQGIVEFRPRQEGNTLHLILAPNAKTKPGEKSHEKPQHKAAPAPQPPAQGVSKRRSVAIKAYKF